MKERTLFEKLGGTYHEENGYLVPDLIAPEKESLGQWAERRWQFLRENNRNLYDAMLLSGKLEAHLAEIDREAAEMMETLTAKLKSLEGVTEKLKAEDQMAWVQAMNAISVAATEIVAEELINA